MRAGVLLIGCFVLSVVGSEVIGKFVSAYLARLDAFNKSTTTHCCQEKVINAFNAYAEGFLTEGPLPFENVLFKSQCESDLLQFPPLMPSPPIANISRGSMRSLTISTFGMLKNFSWSVSGDGTITHKHCDELHILYIILVHQHQNIVTRLIDTLNNPDFHQSFVVHVDDKATAAPIWRHLTEHYKHIRNVHILPQSYRQTLTWGGFSIVNATIMSMKYAVEVAEISFDYVVNLSGVSYPLKSNRQIRRVLAQVPGQVFMQVAEQPLNPHPELWAHYEECDGRLHRVARLPLPRGLNLYLGSQWFAMPRNLAMWMLYDELPISFIEYSKHTVVADESYFATMWRASPFCEAEVSPQVHYASFGRWESAKEKDARDPGKCLSVNPDVCGRSPVILSSEQEEALRVAPHLFARKFDPDDLASARLLDAIDRWRAEADTETFQQSKTQSSEDTCTAQNEGSVYI